MSFGSYGTKTKLPGGVEAPKAFSSRINYSDIRLSEDEFVDMVDRFQKHLDTHNLLTEEIIAEVKLLAGGNAALTSSCLQLIARDFPKYCEVKTENQIQAFILNGSLESKLYSEDCRTFRSYMFDEFLIMDKQKDLFIEVLGKLVKNGEYTISDENMYNVASVLIKRGICAVNVKNDYECLEFTCPLTAIHYQK